MSVAATASNFVLERQMGLVERTYLTGKRLKFLNNSLLVSYREPFNGHDGSLTIIIC